MVCLLDSQSIDSEIKFLTSSEANIKNLSSFIN